jgi:hypothetical protein
MDRSIPKMALTGRASHRRRVALTVRIKTTRTILYCWSQNSGYLARSGPDHLRAQRGVANVLRSHRPT